MARIANKTAKEANDIAKFANNPQIELRADEKFIFTFFGCNWQGTQNYQTYVTGKQVVLINNSGGMPTSLIGVSIPNSNYEWQLWLYGDSERNIKIDLPYDIPAGSSRKIFIDVAAVTSRWNDSSSAPNADINSQVSDFLKNNSDWQWNFEFGNAGIAILKLGAKASDKSFLEFEQNFCLDW